MPKQKGFTLVELMIALAIMSILAMIAIPAVGNAIRKSQEAVTIANLAILRMSIASYNAETGDYPTDNLDSLIGFHLRAVPVRYAPTYHPSDSRIVNAECVEGSGGWCYCNQNSSPRFGEITVNCTHLNLRGQPWATPSDLVCELEP